MNHGGDVLRLDSVLLTEPSSYAPLPPHRQPLIQDTAAMGDSIASLSTRLEELKGHESRVVLQRIEQLEERRGVRN